MIYRWQFTSPSTIKLWPQRPAVKYQALDRYQYDGVDSQYWRWSCNRMPCNLKILCPDSIQRCRVACNTKSYCGDKTAITSSYLQIRFPILIRHDYFLGHIAYKKLLIRFKSYLVAKRYISINVKKIVKKWSIFTIYSGLFSRWHILTAIGTNWWYYMLFSFQSETHIYTYVIFAQRIDLMTNEIHAEIHFSFLIIVPFGILL